MKFSQIQRILNEGAIPVHYILNGRKNIYIKSPDDYWIQKNTGKRVSNDMSKQLDGIADKQIQQYNSSTSGIKIGQRFEDEDDGQEYHFNGSKFVDYDGDEPKLGSRGRQIVDDMLQKNQDAINKNKDTVVDEPENENKKDDQVPNDETQGTPEPSDESGNNDPQPEPQDEEDAELKSLAEQIKQHPKVGRLITLISRGDEVSMLAVDIILSGKEQQATQIINDLNAE